MSHSAHGCGHNRCGACCGGGCTGCGGTLLLTKEEIDLLRCFAETPFLPVSRQRDSEIPIYLEDNAKSPQEISKSITGLQQKQLIRLDYDLPLSNFDYRLYEEDYLVHGSMALTARGQQAVELLEIYGIEE